MAPTEEREEKKSAIWWLSFLLIALNFFNEMLKKGHLKSLFFTLFGRQELGPAVSTPKSRADPQMEESKEEGWGGHTSDYNLNSGGAGWKL